MSASSEHGAQRTSVSLVLSKRRLKEGYVEGLKLDKAKHLLPRPRQRAHQNCQIQECYLGMEGCCFFVP